MDSKTMEKMKDFLDLELDVLNEETYLVEEMFVKMLASLKLDLANNKKIGFLQTVKEVSDVNFEFGFLQGKMFIINLLKEKFISNE